MKQVLPFFALLALVGCDIPGGPDDNGREGSAPEITSFTASPNTITAAGQPVTLEWMVSGAVTSLEIDQDVGSVNGSSVTVTPAATTTYTLSARNSSGEDEQSTTVTLSGTTPPPTTPPPTTPPGTDTTPPQGDFGVSEDPEGPFTSDRGGDVASPTDERVLQLEPGDTFYAQVAYSDAGGVAEIRIRLNNSSPAGLAADLVTGRSVGGFTLVGPVGRCDLAARPTDLTCVYEIRVGDDVVNIDQLPGAGDEFAYVFRTYVSDAAGNESNTPPRGYVTVGEAGGGTPAPPAPDDNEAPTAAFTVTPEDENTFAFDGADSSDPDSDPLRYAWSFGDGSTANTGTVTKSYDEDGTFSVTLTVTDPEGLSDSETQSVSVGDDTPDDETVIESFLVNGEVSVTVDAGDELEFSWTLSGDEPAFLLLSKLAADGSPDETRVPAESGSVTLPADETAVYELSATDGSIEDPASVDVEVN